MTVHHDTEHELHELARIGQGSHQRSIVCRTPQPFRPRWFADFLIGFTLALLTGGLILTAFFAAVMP